MVPIGELRASIPWGMFHLGQPWYVAFLLSLVGNSIPALILPWVLGRIADWLLSFPNPAGRLLAWRTARLQAKYKARIEKYGLWALALFVGIPLPFTGVWTGLILAWAFGIPPRKSIPFLCLGVLMAGVIVTILAVAIGEAAGFWLKYSVG